MSRDEVTEAVEPVFARHETFQPRYGWLKKAVDITAEDSRVFYADDATVRFGVGKNMVRSIRYWGQAFKIVMEHQDLENSRRTVALPTRWGRSLLGDGGWDPFLEHLGSLWLLHWLLLRPPCTAPAWYAAFNEMRGIQFEDAELVAHLVDMVDRNGWDEVSSSSLKRDVDCFVRMYATRKKARDTIEDVLDSPFRELELLHPVPGEKKKIFQFNHGPKSSLPSDIVLFSCLDYVSARDVSARTVSISELAHVAGGPGRAFKLPESALYQALENAAAQFSEIGVAQPGGIKQLSFDEHPREMSERVLEAHFAKAMRVERQLDPYVAPEIELYTQLSLKELKQQLAGEESPEERLYLSQAREVVETRSA